jgi:hypothetical protein
MNTHRTRFLKGIARWLWFLTAGAFVLLFLLGVRPALAALMAPTDALASIWTVDRALKIVNETAINPAIYAYATVVLRGVIPAVQIALGFLIVQQQQDRKLTVSE